MFRSYFLAGFECATGYNRHGEWIDQITATEHDRHVDEDYVRLTEVGIHAVREAIRWPLVDRAGTYDFSTVQPFIDAALRHDIDIIWDLFHFGYPEDLDPFADEFSERFANYCRAAALYVKRHMSGVCYFTPINEPSYFAWAAGDEGLFAPYAKNRGAELKISLARAALRGIAAIREACPGARIVNVDPICRVVPSTEDPAELAMVKRYNEEAVFEFWDMVSGRLRPELGGSPENLDIVGINYYWTNQWAFGREDVPLADDDPRRASLADLVRRVWQRYGAEVVITETSALGEARAPWIHELSLIAEQLLDEEIKLNGICLYPILGMPEWHDRNQWMQMGLWDLERDQNRLQRKACAPMLKALRAAQRKQLQRLRSVEQVFTLLRTGKRPLKVQGRLLWHTVERDLPYHIKLIRSDRPYPRWIAAIELSIGSTFVEHVSTASDLSILVDQLRWMNPTRLAEEFGLFGDFFDAASHASWHQDLKAMADHMALEDIPESRREYLPTPELAATSVLQGNDLRTV